MTAEELRDFVHRLQGGLWNYDKLVSVQQMLRDDFVFHGPSGEFHGARAFRNAMEEELDAVSDLFLSIEDQFACGDRIAVRYSASFIPHGVFIGRFPAGKMVRVEGITLHRLIDGKVAETWHAYDRLRLVREIGLFERLSEDDEAAIRSAAELASDAFASGMIERSVDLRYSPDAEFVRGDETTLQGKDAIVSSLRELPRGSRVAQADLLIDGAGEIAYCRGSYRILTPLERSPRESGRFLEIWRRQPDRSWRVVRRLEQAEAEALTFA